MKKFGEPPMHIKVWIDRDPYSMSDAEIAIAVRQVFDRRFDARQTAYDSVSAKLGTPVVIDGVQYPSKARAMKALGVSLPKLQKMIDTQGVGLATPPGDG